MVEEMPEGAIIFAPDGTILYSNVRFAELLKMPRQRVVGSALQGIVARDERRTVEAMVEQARRDPTRRGLKLQAADGSAVPVLFSAHSLTVAGAESIAAVVTDLSEQAAANEAKARLALIVESSEDAIVSTDFNGVVQTWNAAAEHMFGYTAAEAIGCPVQQLIAPPEQAEEFSRLLDEARSGTGLHMEAVRRRKDGALIDVSITRASIRDDAGRIVGASAILRDITGRKQLEAALREHQEHLEEMIRARTGELEAATKDLEGFAYSISHDLRVPLRAVDGFSQALLKRYADQLDDEGKHYLNVLRDNATRMGQLIEDVLLYSRTQRQAITLVEMNMDTLVRESIEDLKPSLAGRALSIEVKPLPTCRGDRELLRKVWAALLGNAIKFTRQKAEARIEVGGGTEGIETAYYVKDNGAGFDMQYADKLFGVFQRLHSVEEFEGTGIGLAIVKLAVTRLGGRVWAEGKVGEGATFYFALPQQERK